MTGSAHAPDNTQFTKAFIQEWLNFIAQEHDFQQQILGQSLRMSEALIAGDQSVVDHAQQQLAALQQQHLDQERKRDALRLASSRHVHIPLTELSMAHIIDHCSDSDGMSLTKASQQLKDLLLQVKAAQDRNQQLMRTSLNLIADTLAVIVGNDQVNGYERSGHRDDIAPPRGNVLNFQA